jgi:hypothetical protein
MTLNLFLSLSDTKGRERKRGGEDVIFGVSIFYLQRGNPLPLIYFDFTLCLGCALSFVKCYFSWVCVRIFEEKVMVFLKKSFTFRVKMMSFENGVF